MIKRIVKKIIKLDEYAETCKTCGVEAPFGDTERAAYVLAKGMGWKEHIVKKIPATSSGLEYYFICPSCQKKRDEEKVNS